MALDVLGEWLNLGEIVPSFNDWVSYELIQPFPSQVIRATFVNFQPDKAYSFVRVRGIYFTALRADVTFSVKLFPSRQTRVIELPIADEILGQENWQLAIEIKKYKGYRKFLGQLNDQSNYSVQIESWSAKKGFYLAPSEVEQSVGIIPRGSGRYSNSTLSNQVPNGVDEFIG